MEKVYLDAPVLDMKTWPPKGSNEYDQMIAEYGLNDDAFLAWKGNPIDNMEAYFALRIPTMIVAGGADEVVPFAQNSGKMIEFCKQNGYALPHIIKPECKHHPHSLDNIQPIIEFIDKRNLL